MADETEIQNAEALRPKPLRPAGSGAGSLPRVAARAVRAAAVAVAAATIVAAAVAGATTTAVAAVAATTMAARS